MKENKNFSIDIRIEPSRDKTIDCHFCQALITTRAGKIGNPDAWEVVGTVGGAIDDLLALLLTQNQTAEAKEFLAGLSTQELFAALHSWRRDERDSWREGDEGWSYRNECSLHGVGNDCFLALPQGTELFDGEFAFLVKIGADESRLIWRDFESRDTREVPVSFNEYVLAWQAVYSRIHSTCV